MEDRLDQACAWIARLRSDAISDADRRAFASWMSGSPANRQAFDEMTELWGDLGALSHMPLDELYPESVPSSNSRAGSQPTPPSSTTRSNSTLSLADGSQVQLNTNSELIVNFSRDERRTQLLRGEAFFDVARQTSRPFTVAAGEANIRVLGTQFNVERNPDNTRVSVTGGTVAVSEARTASGLQPESVKLTRNQKVSVSNSGLSEVGRTSADEALDWTRGQLVFDRTPLDEALEELNRYLKVPAAAAPNVGEQTLSGTFELTDPESTLAAIAAALDLD
ncbi:FecR family protein [Microbulbifer elongatus]|nr:FecR domain-containing protein [Microbulbifer elongatus]